MKLVGTATISLCAPEACTIAGGENLNALDPVASVDTVPSCVVEGNPAVESDDENLATGGAKLKLDDGAVDVDDATADGTEANDCFSVVGRAKLKPVADGLDVEAEVEGPDGVTGGTFGGAKLNPDDAGPAAVTPVCQRVAAEGGSADCR